jgi:mRNA interferase RelE/StbE
LNRRLEITASAEKELNKLPPEIHRRIVGKIALLINNPRPPHSSRKLSKPLDGYRLRVGNYRVFYIIDDAEGTVLIYAVRHRREAYR